MHYRLGKAFKIYTVVSRVNNECSSVRTTAPGRLRLYVLNFLFVSLCKSRTVTGKDVVSIL